MRKLIAALVVLASSLCLAQNESATLSGRVADSSGAAIVGAQVVLTNTNTNVEQRSRTNKAGLYVFTGLRPGEYRVAAGATGFKTLIKEKLTLHVQDELAENFLLTVGSVSESITVNADAEMINTTDAAVSTVIDHKFVENMPLNGRSFQDLLTLAPGVAQVSTNYSNAGTAGEISVNGQRAEANYFTVDGVSANTGTGVTESINGAGYAGAVPAETVLGTTQTIVPVDGLQEFRASTSTYSAEYGRTPGGQFSFLTRSGTNAWHGSLYDYFRNEVMDANNWFNNNADPKVPRLADRQNDFGGTFSGPVLIPGLFNGKNRTFFFFTYEGLRLRIPQPVQSFFVPDATFRRTAPQALQPFLNVFPQPNGAEDGLGDGLAAFNLAYSSPSSLNSVGLKVDQNVGDHIKLFARYGRTGSQSTSLSSEAMPLAQFGRSQTLTVGASFAISRTQENEFRFNVSQNNSAFNTKFTDQYGAVPLDLGSIPAPNGSPLSPLGTALNFCLCYGPSSFNDWSIFQTTSSQRQYNLTDSHSWVLGKHQFKAGFDWRVLDTYVQPIQNSITGYFYSESSVLSNLADFAGNSSFTSQPVKPHYENYSFFVEDEWKASSRISLSLGIRWDIDPAPTNLNGPSPYTLNETTDLGTAKLAPAGTPLWKTYWGGFAPRLGIAYRARTSPRYETVLRAGWGMFYDMGNTNGSVGFTGIGFQSTVNYFGVAFPLTTQQVTLPPPSIAAPYNGLIVAFDPNLKLPYTMHWNAAVEQELGKNQNLTVSYVGSAGRRLLTEFQYIPSNPNFGPAGSVFLTQNGATSDYDALQTQFQKILSNGLQVLASYSWSHSIDDASSNFLLYELLRGSSDTDLRHNFQAAVTYNIPGSYSNHLAKTLLEDWGLDARISARSAFPVDIIGLQTVDPATGKFLSFHSNRIAGQPLYVYGPQYPGGRAINCDAFLLNCDIANLPSGEGNAGRNAARGFDAIQSDLAVRRTFQIHETLRLQFRAEAFNVFNHPIFSGIFNYVTYGPQYFGRATSTLNNSLGGLNPLYQSGGPRSLQLALKFEF